MTDEIYLRVKVSPEGPINPGTDTPIPWADVLEHAPTAELVAALRSRPSTGAFHVERNEFDERVFTTVQCPCDIRQIVREEIRQATKTGRNP